MFSGYGVAVALELVGTGGFVAFLWRIADRRMSSRETSK